MYIQPTSLLNSCKFAPLTCRGNFRGSVEVKGHVHIYRSLAKKGPVSNIRPPPYFALISCKGPKFTLKSAHLVDLAR